MVLEKFKAHTQIVSFGLLTPVLIGTLWLSGCTEEHFQQDMTENEASSMLVGMCFDDPSEENTIKDDKDNISANNFPIIDCNSSHDNEVYYKFNLPDAKAYVETDSLLNTVLDICEDKFKGYIGRSYQKSYYEMSALTPTVDSWQDGDREVICYAFHPDAEKLNRSLKAIKE